MSTTEASTAKGTIRILDEDAGRCKLEDAKRTVSKLKGVLNVETNHVTHMLHVEYNPKKITIDQIRSTLKERN